jgi:hypothetical protein
MTSEIEKTSPICGRCYDDVSETLPANCDEKPELLKGQPIGQYHCPNCGAMVLAGMPHPELCSRCLKREHPGFDYLVYESISPTMRTFLGAWEGFRRMGFPSDNLYLQTSRSIELGGKLGAYLVLRWRGKEFSVFAGAIESEEAASKEYRQVTKAIGSKKVLEADLDRIWEESIVRKMAGPLIAAMMKKGIVPPSKDAS